MEPFECWKKIHLSFLPSHPLQGEFPLYGLSEDVLLFPAEPEQETMVITY